MAASMRNFISARHYWISRLKSHVNYSRSFSLCHSYHAKYGDIRKLFVDEEVQSILRRITGFDMNKINAPQLIKLQESRVELLTDEQIEKIQAEARIAAEEKIVMPPVMEPREEINETLANDPSISELITDRMIFTDITFGVPDRERISVVREPDGKLRSATWDERERMQQIFFPREGRKLRMPKMFLDENLSLVLDNGRYVYAMERACLQFEPDDPKFIQIVSTVYDHVLENKQFESLRSTRHFGPMAFYYARNNTIDQLLIYFLNQNELGNAADAVHLLHTLHPDLPSAVRAREEKVTDSVQLLELYCETGASEKGAISLLLQSQKEGLAES